MTWAQLFDAPLLVRTLPFEPVDGGGLQQARTVAAMYFLVTRLAHRYGFQEHGHDIHQRVHLS
ncbi:hypothetical protein [Archangium sp.]|uniref:hypothetical protein n=1 Tax=Archangium sp. TaxID=1872627 RepID=UPI00286B3E9E|nr:hypothetical protein [Archangium sp.]